MVIFRNDDINPSTDTSHMRACYRKIKELYPDSQIWSCITLFGRKNDNGSVYENPPFKDKPKEWFYFVDRYFPYQYQSMSDKICSHGLVHVDHTKISEDAQEMSIVVSCSKLGTRYFVPPFNRYNTSTRFLCEKHNIHLVTKTMWKNLKYNEFDPNHKLWYFHSWEWDIKELCEKLK